MASSQLWCEYNGSSPTETNPAPDCNWKMIDVASGAGGNAYTANPVPSGSFSVWKILSLQITGGTGGSTVSALNYTLSANGNPSLSTSPNWRVLGTVQPTFVQPANNPSLPYTTSLPSSGAGGTTWPVYLLPSGAGCPGTFCGVTNQAFTTSSTGPFNSSVVNGPVTIPATQILYATALYTQFQTGTGVAPGIFGPYTITATWTES